MWETKESTSSSSIMGVLFIIIIIWAIFGGGLGGFGRTAYADGVARVTDCSGTSNCQVEKQTIINTATTQNLINQQAEATRAQATSLYIQDQATQLFDSKMRGMEERILMGQQLASKDAEIYALKGQIYADAKFNELALGQERISCRMLKQPELFGQAVTGACQPVPNFNGCGCL